MRKSSLLAFALFSLSFSASAQMWIDGDTLYGNEWIHFDQPYFKTLVAQGDRTGPVVFVIPGPYELDLRKAAGASGNKRVELIRVKELQPLTGYIRGGCSPVGMKKTYPTFVDETAQLFPRIHVSAGVRGAQLLLAPGHLLRAVDGTFADLI